MRVFRMLLPVALLAASSAQAFADDAWTALRKPGHFGLLRHANAPGSVPESNDMDFKNCAIQRNLDEEGRTQAVRIGDAFRKNGIRQARLVASQYCRAIETAKLMKLGNVGQLSALNQTFLIDPSGMREAGAKAIAYMRKLKNGPPPVLVTHVTNIQSIADVQLASGEMAVVHFDSTGKVVVDGRVGPP
jgi:phosphohistidine phosphatase SixA